MVCSWLDKLAIDKLNGRALDTESVVGPAMKLISESMMVECVVPKAASPSFRPSEFCLPVADDLQAHEHENSRVVTPPIVEGKYGFREHSPRPKLRIQQSFGVSNALLCSAFKPPFGQDER